MNPEDDLVEPPRRIRFQCTGLRAKHASRLVGELDRYYNDIFTPADALQAVRSRLGGGGRAVTSRRPIATVGRGQSFSDQIFTLSCPTCPTTVVWKIDRALRVVDAIIAKRIDVGQTFGPDGRVGVDLADLPASLR